MARIAGIVLAAGRGRRMGAPKALLRLPSGESYIEAACAVLARAGCAPVVAVLGAQGHAAIHLLAGNESLDVEPVTNDDWREGMSTSLRCGLHALRSPELAGSHGAVDAAVIHLVDLPDVGERVVSRVISEAEHAPGAVRSALARATYDGLPGHPVLLGADHFDGVLASLDGDAGARGYLRTHPVDLVEVSDLATGRDIDTPEERLTFEAEYRA